MNASRFALLVLVLAACSDGGGLPTGLRATPDGTGPRVEWQLDARPVANVPLPNDVATSPDPTSRTGRRLNASLVAPTHLEQRTRAEFDKLDGWGTFAPITVAFDAPLDTDELLRAQGPGTFANFGQHAVYVVNLRTGVPVPLDVGAGNFNFNLQRPDNYAENDPRGSESNLFFETVEEDTNANGILDRGEDTDFDGVLDHPNTLSGRLDPSNPTDTYDNLMLFYERETNTLILRPVVPLDEETEYAVVLTDRLVGTDHQPVRSPFPYVHHVSQRASLEKLPALFAAKPNLYGDLATRGWGGVSFAWTFTTQSVTHDLTTIRDGLYGTGPLARLAAQFPPDLIVSRAINPDGDSCTEMAPIQLNRPYIAPVEALKNVAEQLAPMAFGLSPESTTKLLSTFDAIDHIVVVFFRVPYFLGDPGVQNTSQLFDVNTTTGEGRIGSDIVPLIITIPKETAAHRQPFPVALYGHGYTSSHLESLGFGGLLASHGVASAGIVAQGHGLVLDPGQDRLMRALFGAFCIEGLGSAALLDRARDQNFDGQPDSGGDFWTSYVFHTRDVIRQSVVDQVQAIRVLRALDGTRRAVPGHLAHNRPRFDPIEFDGDFDRDGTIDLAGDFDADGTPDIGGPDVDYFSWGQSLGAVVSGAVAGVEPYVTVAAPSAGAGGLLDVGLRTTESEVKEAVVLRLMGPLLTAVPIGDSPDRAETACASGQRSLREVVVDLNDRVNVEIGCVDADSLQDGDAVVLRNFGNHETRCAGAGADGRFRIGVPADTGDPLQIEVYRGGAFDMDYATCTFREGSSAHALVHVQDRFTSAAGEYGSSPGLCERCGHYQATKYALDDPLVAVTEGYGLPRQSAQLRRFMSLAQIAIEPADPVNWAPRIFLHPDPQRPGRGPRSVLVMESLGDNTVPVNSGLVYARAAGVLPFMPSDAPDEYADYRAPRSFEARYGVPTPNDVFISNYVSEGIARLERHPIPGFADWLFDPDDLSEGLQRYIDRNGNPPPVGEPGTSPPRLSPPLRWVRESRAVTSPTDDVWTAPGTSTGMSGVITFMVEPGGEHGFDPVAPSKTWDEGEYLANLLGWYFRSGGSELLYHTQPATHLCLETSSCAFDR